MKIIICFIGLLTSFHAWAQKADTVSASLKLSATGSLNKTNDGTSYLLNNNLSFGARKGRSALNLNAAWLYGGTPEKRTNSDIALSSNVNLYRSGSEFYYWGLLNYTSSYSLNIKSQGQLGIGVAYNLLNKKNIWLNISDGILGERSRIIETDSSIVSYQTIRNSLRIQFQYLLAERLQFRTSNYFQPSFEQISDHILSSDSELSYSIWKGLSMASRFTYNKIGRTGKQNLIFTYGLSYLHQF
ncbi:hypothetical protein GCM10027051_11960 [Niabella terrae]